MKDKPGPGRRRVLPPGLARALAVNLFLLAAGSAVYVIGVKGILTPHRFLTGGIVGVALMIHYAFPSLGLGLLYALLTGPLFVLGWFRVSHSFILYTAFGTAIFALAAEVLPVRPFPVENPLLAALLAGIVCGLGAGLMLRSAGTAGGLDILAVYLYNRFNFSLGGTTFAANGLILLGAAVVYDLELALYALIFVFTASKVIDQVVTGFNRHKSILIVSDKAEEIARVILTKYERGATFLDGQGAYSGLPTRVILSIVTLMDLAQVKARVLAVDPEAFVIVEDTLEVLGTRYGRRPLRESGASR